MIGFDPVVDYPNPATLAVAEGSVTQLTEPPPFLMMSPRSGFSTNVFCRPRYSSSDSRVVSRRLKVGVSINSIPSIYTPMAHLTTPWFTIPVDPEAPGKVQVQRLCPLNLYEGKARNSAESLSR